MDMSCMCVFVCITIIKEEKLMYLRVWCGVKNRVAGSRESGNDVNTALMYKILKKI